MFHQIIILGLLIIFCIQYSYAVRCNDGTDPCQLLTGKYFPPDYTCFEPTNDNINVYCTCPDGQISVNSPCRICNTISCGPGGTCLEPYTGFVGLYYACGCRNNTEYYANPGPCPDSTITTTTTTATTTTTQNPLFTTTTNPSGGVCLNNGVYNPLTGTCLCVSGFSGPRCEISQPSALCNGITCANGGVCNIVNSQSVCWCLLGFSGEYCERIGTSGRCTPGLCTNNGVCSELTIGVSTFAYCTCPAGFTGQCCQQRYFECPMVGIFADSAQCKFGKYFQCSGSPGAYTLASLSCPKGLRYNFMTNRCSNDVTCPP